MDLERVRQHSPVSRSSARVAAVLVPLLYRNDKPLMLFTKRADHLGEHPGQMSFPGGGREEWDTSLFNTATREAHEEIGLGPNEIKLIGQLDDIVTVTNYVVTPFVVIIPDREYEPEEQEVAEIVNLPFDALSDTTNYESKRRTHPKYGPIDIHSFTVNDYTVWGATARILAQLLQLATNWQTPENFDQIPNPDTRA